MGQEIDISCGNFRLCKKPYDALGDSGSDLIIQYSKIGQKREYGILFKFVPRREVINLVYPREDGGGDEEYNFSFVPTSIYDPTGMFLTRMNVEDYDRKKQTEIDKLLGADELEIVRSHSSLPLVLPRVHPKLLKANELMPPCELANLIYHGGWNPESVPKYIDSKVDLLMSKNQAYCREAIIIANEAFAEFKKAKSFVKGKLEHSERMALHHFDNYESLEEQVQTLHKRTRNYSRSQIRKAIRNALALNLPRHKHSWPID